MEVIRSWSLLILSAGFVSWCCAESTKAWRNEGSFRVAFPAPRDATWKWDCCRWRGTCFLFERRAEGRGSWPWSRKRRVSETTTRGIPHPDSVSFISWILPKLSEATERIQALSVENAELLSLQRQEIAAVYDERQEMLKLHKELENERLENHRLLDKASLIILLSKCSSTQNYRYVNWSRKWCVSTKRLSSLTGWYLICRLGQWRFRPYPYNTVFDAINSQIARATGISIYIFLRNLIIHFGFRLSR